MIDETMRIDDPFAFPFWEAAGETLYGARLAVVVYSLISIVLAALSARSISGTMAGLVAALLLALSPTYLKNSRLALVEIPALVPALLALWLMLHARRQRSTVRVGLSAASLAIALMTKPMVMPVIAPCAMLLLL